MRNLETEAATWSRGAVVRVYQGDSNLSRPALFVFPLPGGGAAWVEPSYLDAFGAPTPAAHIASGPVEDITPQHADLAFFRLVSDSWKAVVYPADEEDPVDVREALAAGLEALKRAGTTWSAERARVIAELAAQPATAG